MKILAAVVTHNRSSLLARCLVSLKAQSRALDEIVVINNGSTDDTEEVVRSMEIRCITQANVGSAGGWSRAISHALEGGFDAVWLMDDDGYPDALALEILETHMVAGTACVSSVVLQETDHERFVFPFPRLTPSGLPVLVHKQRKVQRMRELLPLAPDGTYPFAHFFNGALISTDAIRKVGNVNDSFFIFGDEVDYFFRLRSVGRVFSALAAHHYHPDVSKRPLSDMKVYYYVKNTMVLNHRYFDNPVLRDGLAIVAAVARTGARNGWRDAAQFVVGAKRGVLREAIVRGWQGQLGKDFNG